MTKKEALKYIGQWDGNEAWNMAVEALRREVEAEEKQKPTRPSLEEQEAIVRAVVPSDGKVMTPNALWERTEWKFHWQRDPIFHAAADTLKVVRERVVPLLKSNSLVGDHSAMRVLAALGVTP